MQRAREPFAGRATAASASRVPAINRTLVWFSGDAERRRRAAAAAQEAPAPGSAARGASPRAAVWRRSEVFGCLALAALTLAAFEGRSLTAVGSRPCRTEPAVLGLGTDLDVKMTLSHNAACAIWANAASISVKDVTITAAPQHGTLALRGRTGVTYRPARGFTGTDSFAFTLQSTSGAAAATARVEATVY